MLNPEGPEITGGVKDGGEKTNDSEGTSPVDSIPTEKSLSQRGVCGMCRNIEKTGGGTSATHRHLCTTGPRPNSTWEILSSHVSRVIRTTHPLTVPNSPAATGFEPPAPNRPGGAFIDSRRRPEAEETPADERINVCACISTRNRVESIHHPESHSFSPDRSGVTRVTGVSLQFTGRCHTVCERRQGPGEQQKNRCW